MPENKAQLKKLLTRALVGLQSLPEKKPELIVAVIGKSGLVNEQYYYGSYPDVAKSKYDAVTHYALYGFNEGRVPQPGLAELIPAVARATGSGFNDPEKFLEKLLALLLTGEEKPGTVRVTRQGSYEALYDLPLYAHWSITGMCNYTCSYCSYRYGIDKRFDKARLVPFQKLINAVENLAAMNRPLYDFVLLGGEPTVHPRLPELLLHAEARLKGRLRRVTIVTNGSRDAAWFNQLADLARRLSLLITISIHPGQARPEHIYSLIKEVDPALDLDFVLMMHPEKKMLVEQIHAELCALRSLRPFKVYMQPIYAPPAFENIDPRYPSDYQTWRNDLNAKFTYAASSSCMSSNKPAHLFHTFWEVSENGKPAILPGGDRSIMREHGLLNFRGMHCVCGTSLARIEEDGSLLGAVCNNAGTRINMYEPNAIVDSSFMRVVTCPSQFCACNDNDINVKFSDTEEAGEYLRMARLKQERLLKVSSNLPL